MPKIDSDTKVPFYHVSLTRNAKGEVQPHVAVYHKDAKKAQELCTQIFEDICSRFRTGRGKKYE